MSFEEQFDLTQETKKVFANFLIFNMKQIEFQIFFSRDVAGAIRSLRGLIGSLDEKSHKTLDPQLQKLREFDAGRGCTRMEIEQIYMEVCAYLHKSHLAEAIKGIFPASSLKSTVPKPKAKRYPKTLSADVT